MTDPTIDADTLRLQRAPESERGRARLESPGERQAPEPLLLAEMRALLDEPMTVSARLSLLVIADRLLRHLSSQVTLDDREGLCMDVLGERPYWHRRIEALRGANATCVADLAEVAHRIAHELPLAKIGEGVRREMQRWMRSLTRVRGRELLLLQEALTLDLGGEA